MSLGTPQMTAVKNYENFNVTLNNTVLGRVKFTKFLDVLIDECLTWKNHIDCVSKTISRNIGVMNKLKHSIPYRLLHTFYCIYLNFALP